MNPRRASAAGRILSLYVGNMASHKTTDFIENVRVLRSFGKKNVLVLKPKKDTRSPKGYIKSWDRKSMRAEEVSENNLWEILDILSNEERKLGRKLDVIAFSEIQFYEKDHLRFYQLIQHLLECGYDIIAEGLNMNFRGEPFVSTSFMIALAGEACRWRWSVCTNCGEEARFPQRIINGEPASYNSPVILVGGKQLYQPRCWKHFSVPDRPYPPKASESKLSS